MALNSKATAELKTLLAKLDAEGLSIVVIDTDTTPANNIYGGLTEYLNDILEEV